MSSTAVHRVQTALRRAGYPPPHAVRGHGCTQLHWHPTIVAPPNNDNHGRPHLAVFDNGNVVIAINRDLDALLGSATHIDAWLTVLHPHIATTIAATAGSDPIPAPAPLRWATLPAFAYLDDDQADGTYATFTDMSRVWLSTADPITTLDSLLGTITGYQLGITVTTTIATATRTGITYLNPAVTTPTATESMQGYQPALATADAIFVLPHPVTDHIADPAHATTIAANKLTTLIDTQNTTGHIYRHR